MAERVFCLHVKTWTWLIALVELVLGAIGLAEAIANIAEEHHNAMAAFIVQLVTQVIWILFILMLLLALIKNRAKLIFPHLLVSVVVVAFFVVQFIIFMFNNIAFWVFLYNVLLIVVVLCCLSVEYRCYLWMKDYTDIMEDY